MLALLASTGRAYAQSDEIQVYDAEIAEPGVFNLTWHDNYTPSGRTAPAFPGGVVPDRSLNGVPEFAYGVTKWMEAGLYLPLYTYDRNGRFELDGFKLRALFVDPDAGQKSFFYGVNFELSFNARHWETKSNSGEIRPIVGFRQGPWTVVFNPIFDTDFNGASRLDFAPETRVAYTLSRRWAVALEEYDDFGAVRSPLAPRAQSHQLFGVIDFTGRPVNVELGAGFGLTPASDRLTVKLILSKDL